MTPLSDIEAPHLGTEAPPLSLDEDGVTCSSPSLAQLPESGCHCEANESAAAAESIEKVYTSQSPPQRQKSEPEEDVPTMVDSGTTLSDDDEGK